jgi:hypothetical protein
MRLAEMFLPGHTVKSKDAAEAGFVIRHDAVVNTRDTGAATSAT